MRPSSIPRQPHQPAAHFSGKQTTEAARRHWHSPQQILTSLESERNPYVGDLPASFLNVSGWGNDDMFQFLDRLAQKVRKSWQGRTYRDNFLNRFRLNRALKNALKFHAPPRTEQGLKIDFVGAGLHGQVFKISCGEEKFALKIMRHSLHPDHLDAARLAANGLFLNGLDAKDVAHFYAANPTGEWVAGELIDEGVSLKNRPGRPLSELGYRIKDDYEFNRVNGIQVDYDFLMRENRR